MSNSPRIGLPYLDAAQAQKHVTMNEALARLDIFAAGRVETMALASPSASPAEGEGHIVPAAASGAWAGHDGTVAAFLNGGWEFISRGQAGGCGSRAILALPFMMAPIGNLSVNRSRRVER